MRKQKYIFLRSPYEEKLTLNLKTIWLFQLIFGHCGKIIEKKEKNNFTLNNQSYTRSEKFSKKLQTVASLSLNF